MCNINILMLIVGIILLFFLLNNSANKYISLGKKNNSSILIIILITLIIFMLIQNNEGFKNIDENVFTGIKGKTTMSNLQELQNNEIQLLEEKAKFVKQFLNKKNEQIEKSKYKKIPIENSCMVLNSNGSINLSKEIPVDSQSLPISPNSSLSKKNFDNITDMLNS